MCLILLAREQSFEYPLVVAANRDEFYRRETAPAQGWDEGWLGGRDLVGAVGLGVSGVGAETGQRPVFDPAGQEGHVYAASRFALRAAKVLPVSASSASWPVKDCQRSMATGSR